MKLKVCGNILPEQVKAYDDLGVDMAGFNFYPSSPRYMRQKISPEKMKQLKGKFARVGIFVNARYDELVRTVEEYRLDMVQLSGDETPEYCNKIADFISVIKVFRLAGKEHLDPLTIPYKNVCDFFMFDTAGTGYGSTGKKFNWKLLEKSPPSKPYFLSGGIELSDVEKLKNLAAGPAGVKLFAVDVNSQFEMGAGVKDMNKLKQFIDQLK
ncbi:MAG TPA: phosphoribosylanthranilate isomerase [Chitinophagaceae bacterium]|nr:phosphoribosylanthranilate isomerase [Chitinophagaceae bacterium]HPN59647.1 phosphoribosylanthranilate isomerase [Chitinophagaceae bacterium]